MLFWVAGVHRTKILCANVSRQKLINVDVVERNDREKNVVDWWSTGVFVVEKSKMAIRNQFQNYAQYLFWPLFHEVVDGVDWWQVRYCEKE